jgi:hypothetical protein
LIWYTKYLIAPYKTDRGGARAKGKKESRAKALLECARKVPVDSRLFFFWSGRDFFAPPVFLPQTWTATSGAQLYCADALHSADKLPYLIPVQFVTMVVVHCTISDQGRSASGSARFRVGEPIESIAVLVIDGVIRFHCVGFSLPRIVRGAHATFSIFSADPA